MLSFGPQIEFQHSPVERVSVPSVVRFDKLATLDRAVIAGKLGNAPADWLAAQSTVFFSVFGFHQK